MTQVRDRSRCIGCLALWLFLLLAGPSSAAPAVDIQLVNVLIAAEGEPNTFRLASGNELAQVGLKRGAENLKVRAGLELKTGDVINTGNHAAVMIRYAEGHEVLMLPNTRIKLGSVFVFFGQLLVRARGYFHIQTNFVTAGVEGTEFLLRTDRQGDNVEVIVSEGAVVCKSNTDLWPAVRVAASEHLSMQSGGNSSQSDTSNGGDGHIIYRGIGNSKVLKMFARGSDLARIQKLGQQFSGATR